MEGSGCNRLLRLEAIVKNTEGEKIRNKEQWFKHNGWGYKDTEFVIDSDGVVRITGNRYQFSGQKMPKFKEWAETEAKLDTSRQVDIQTDIPIDPPVRNEAFIKDVTGKVDFMTDAKITRLDHSHGHSLQEIYALRHGKL